MRPILRSKRDGRQLLRGENSVAAKDLSFGIQIDRVDPSSREAFGSVGSLGDDGRLPVEHREACPKLFFLVEIGSDA